METLPFKVVKAQALALHIECPHCTVITAFDVKEFHPLSGKKSFCSCGAEINYLDRVSIKTGDRP